MGDTAGYDSLSELLLGSFYGSVAADVAAVAPPGGWVLDVGCGPAHLAHRLARDHGLEVTVGDDNRVHCHARGEGTPLPG